MDIKTLEKNLNKLKDKRATLEQKKAEFIKDIDEKIGELNVEIKESEAVIKQINKLQQMQDELLSGAGKKPKKKEKVAKEEPVTKPEPEEEEIVTPSASSSNGLV